MRGLLLLAIYVACVLATAVIAAWMSRRIPAPVLIFLALLPLLFFSPGLFTGKTPLPMGQFRAPPWGAVRYTGHYNPYLDDVVTQFLPWAKAVRLAWSEGELPLRNRWNGCGMPLAANGSSSAFSPLTLISLVLPVMDSFLFMAAAKIFLALTGMYLWLRELRLSTGAALFGAVAFAFSFSMTPWIFFPHTAVLALWPWALFAIEASIDAPIGARAFGLLTAVFALWPIAGHIESVAMGAAFISVWMVTRFLARDLPEPGRLFRRIALAALIAVGLSAFLLIPHALAIGASNRLALVEGRSWASLVGWSPHLPKWPAGLLPPFFPRALGDGIASPTIPGATAGSFPEMGLAYFGISGWAAALLLWRPGAPRRRTALTLWVPLVFGLAAAVSIWPLAQLIGLVPGIRLIFPLRFFSWVALAGPAVAAFELDRLERDFESRAGSASLAAAATAAVLGAFAVAVYLRFRAAHAAVGALPSQVRALVATLGVLALFALLALLAARPRRRHLFSARGAVVALALLCAAELFHQGRRLYRFSSEASLPAQSPLLRFLRSRPRPFRVVGDGYVLYPNTNVFAELEEIRTHDPLERRDYVERLDATAGYAPGDYFKQLRDVTSPILDSLNVRYLVGRPSREAPGPKWRKVYEGPEGRVFENALALPRVYPLSGSAEISGYRERTNTAAFTAHVSAGGTLLATSLVNDGGWTARSPHGPLPTRRINGPFLALELPEGNHSVELRYRPPGFEKGVFLSAATVALLGIGTWFGRRRRPAPMAAAPETATSGASAP